MLEPNNTEQAFDITIAIPTYNGANRITVVLEHLKAQVKTDNLRWEVLIVDNNSQDNIREAIQQYQSKWLPETPLRYCFEPRQGAAFARQKAMKEAAGELVGFLDDDNLPEENWLLEAVSFSHKHPEAGAFSGRIYGCYETPPPEGFEKIKAFLAIRDHGPEVTSFEANKLRLPPAASLVVRKQVWLECVPNQPALTGKLPGLFIQGDDYEPLLYIYKANWKILYNPDLKTSHQIPSQRFERKYLLTLARGCGLATCQLSLITAVNWRKPIIVSRIFLGSLRRVLSQIVKTRGNTQKDLPAAFEFEFALGSLLSPFYIRRW